MRTSLIAGIALLVAGQAHAGTFYDVGVPGGQLTSLSQNGRIAAGVVGGTAWRWNKDSGAIPMDGFLSSYGMNSWGQPVAGAYTPDGNQANAVAALFYSNSNLLGEPEVIGPYPGSAGGFGTGMSEAYGISDNGVAVGLAYDETNNPIAFRWTSAEGMSRLGVNRPNTYSRANGVSNDGNVVYGWNDQDTGYRSGVIWQNGVPLDMLDDLGNPIGEALASNSSGSVVVGCNYGTANGNEAWRWTAATGVQPIGVIAGISGQPQRVASKIAGGAKPAPSLRSERDNAKTVSPDGFFFPAAYAFGVSDNGKVIVGASGTFPVRNAVIWTPGAGMQLLRDYATAHGVTIPTGWELISANAVSADGQSVGGWGVNPNGQIASFVVDMHTDRTFDALLDARGTVAYNDLPSGPFAGVPEGTPVTMSFRMTPDSIELSPGQYTIYPLRLSTFKLQAGAAHDTLVATQDGGPYIGLTNDYPKSDGIHMFTTPTASGQGLEFELFNPGGDMFDSDDSNRIDRTFGPEFFEKTSWIVMQGDQMMWIQLDSVRISDYRPRISPR